MKSTPKVPKNYYTLCLDIENRPCVVIGGGEVARRKTAALKDAGASVKVVSPKLESVLEYMAFQKEIQWVNRDFQADDIKNAYIVIAATDDRKTNKEISDLCKNKDILCNIVDNPDEGTFITPSNIERGPLTIAISTSGISPTLASHIRQEMEIVYGEEYGTFLEMVAVLRPIVLEEFPSPQIRHRVFERMVASRALSLLRSGLREEAQKELEQIVYEMRQSTPR